MGDASLSKGKHKAITLYDEAREHDSQDADVMLDTLIGETCLDVCAKELCGPILCCHGAIQM
jgi:hypothetical protein